MDPSDYNTQNMEESEYGYFEASVDDIDRMASNNSTGPGTGLPDTPTSRIHGRKLRSTVWQHFKQITVTEHGKQITKASCKYCEKILLGSGNGTSHLKRHAVKYFAKNANNVGTSQSQINFPEGGGMGNFSYSNVRMREGLAIYTAAAEQPFTFGADPRFERFQQNYVNPQFRSVSRTTIRSDCFKTFQIQKNQLINELRTQKFTISCTSDM